MRLLVACGPIAAQRMRTNPTMEAINIMGVPSTCGLLALPNDLPDTIPPGVCAIRVVAVSCGFQDQQAVIATAFQRQRPNGFAVLGTDLCGVVVACGEGNGDKLRPGDRVFLDTTKARGGLIHASKEYRLVSSDDLIKVPATWTVEEAACFATPAAGANAVIRRAGVRDGQSVLVTGARSAVSLAIVSLLRKFNIQLTVCTTSSLADSVYEGHCRSARVLHCSRKRHVRRVSCGEALSYARTVGGFDVIIDPFFESYFPELMEGVKSRGVYAALGWGDRISSPGGADAMNSEYGSQRSLGACLERAVEKCIELRFSGHGSRQDLDAAVKDCSEQQCIVPIDSVHEGRGVGPFVSRTFVSEERFGRAVYRYTEH